jgi:hypothetical protein
MKKEYRIYDPRPDIEKDSKLWQELLNLEIAIKYNISWILHGFRCQGTMLVKQNGGYVLRPLIGENGWKSVEEYKKYRDIYLVPQRDKIAMALKELAKQTAKAGI